MAPLFRQQSARTFRSACEGAFSILFSANSWPKKNGLTQAKLARRIGKTADVISRWLGAPSNMTIDTISDLLLGIGPEELELSSSPLLHRSPVNYSHLDELGSIADMSASPEQRSDKISAIDIAANELSQQQRIASIDARP